MKKSFSIIVLMLLTFISFSQSKLDFSKTKFILVSKHLDVITVTEEDRSAESIDQNTTISYTLDSLHVFSPTDTVSFRVIGATFDGIDKTSFVTEQGALISYRPHDYFSYKFRGKPEMEYFFSAFEN